MIALSICIPTYNHADYLDRMLAQLVSLPTFQAGEVEIVISDNASTDATPSVTSRYQAAYPQTVHVFRNHENIHDANFGLALSRGAGMYLKLANDTLLITEEGLAELLAAVKRHAQDEPLLFFSNQSTTRQEVVCESFDAFFDEVSFHCTWIGSFGIWKRAFAALPDFARARDLQLTQVDVVARMLAQKGRAIVNRFHFADSMPRPWIGGYNLAQIFGRNYFAILRPYINSGLFSTTAVRRERFRMLRHHILPFYLSFNKVNGFPKRGYVRYLFRDYWTSLFFWLTVPFVVAVECASSIVSCLCGGTKK